MTEKIYHKCACGIGCFISLPGYVYVKNIKDKQDTKHIMELFDNPLWHDSITFFVNKERDRIRNIVIDNLTLPNCKGLSERGKGFREATTTAKKVLLIHIGENEKEVCNYVLRGVHNA
jgi:hypothetical protein